jgi:threonyl-tRNA synthetase
MPKRFGITYTDQNGADKHPVIIHRAILGSYERFVAILIEHFAGAFPLWLAPEQVRIATVNDDPATIKFATELEERLLEAEVQATLDDSNQSVGKKIREAEVWKVPYTVVIGEKEVKTGKLVPRVRGDMLANTGEATELSVDEFITTLANEIKGRVTKSSL